MSILDKIKDMFTQNKTKTVYRYISQRELGLLENGDFESLGSTYSRKEVSNTHKYNEDEKYLHFFDSTNLPSTVLHSLSKTKEFLCEFEIDKSILSHHKGTGYYTPQGYDFDYTSVTEYAIPTSEYNPNWLTSITPISSYDMQNTINFANTPPPEQ